MKGFVVIKNLKGALEDIMSTVPEGAKAYTLLVDVALFEKVVKQVEVDEEDNDVTFIFKPAGAIRIIPTPTNANPNPPEYRIEDGHITTPTH